MKVAPQLRRRDVDFGKWPPLAIKSKRGVPGRGQSEFPVARNCLDHSRVHSNKSNEVWWQPGNGWSSAFHAPQPHWMLRPSSSPSSSSPAQRYCALRPLFGWRIELDVMPTAATIPSGQGPGTTRVRGVLSDAK